MSKQRQFRRGSSAQHATFVGALAEVTVDTTKNAVVVHDGSTPGGFPAQREIDIRSNASSLGGAPQSINFTNGVTASGSNGAFAVALSNTGVTPGSYGPVAITVDGTGRITAAAVATSIASATTANQLAAPRTINLTGDVSGSVSSDFSGTVNVPTTLAPSGVTAGTYERVTVNSRGIVTAGENSGSMRLWQTINVSSGTSFVFDIPTNAVSGKIELVNLRNGILNPSQAISMQFSTLGVYRIGVSQSFDHRVFGNTPSSGATVFGQGLLDAQGNCFIGQAGGANDEPLNAIIDISSFDSGGMFTHLRVTSLSSFISGSPSDWLWTQYLGQSLLRTNSNRIDQLRVINTSVSPRNFTGGVARLWLSF